MVFKLKTFFYSWDFFSLGLRRVPTLSARAHAASVNIVPTSKLKRRVTTNSPALIFTRLLKEIALIMRLALLLALSIYLKEIENFQPS